MIKYRLRKNTGIIIVIILILFYGTKGFAQDHRPARKNHKSIENLHDQYVPLYVRGEKYFFNKGLFYHKTNYGYVVVKAPFGAILVSLPVGFQRLIVGDTTYYFYGGVYYSKAPGGYMVIEPPRELIVYERTPRPYGVYEKVMVTTDILNVRNSPGMEFSVNRKIFKGDILVVRGNAPGWLYVELPHGKFGWVMSEYVLINPPCQSG